MHIELIDLLRCPKEHEETWLVAAFTKVENRFVIEAKLGCPVCNASYVISNGIADLREQRVERSIVDESDANPEAAMRVAALLNLTVPNSLAVLEGAYASTANLVSEMTQCRLIALNPTEEVHETETVGVALSDARIPLASHSLHGLAVENSILLADAPRVVRPGGRVATPTPCELPVGVVEITKDDRDTVGQTSQPVVALRRGQRER